MSLPSISSSLEGIRQVIASSLPPGAGPKMAAFANAGLAGQLVFGEREGKVTALFGFIAQMGFFCHSPDPSEEFEHLKTLCATLEREKNELKSHTTHAEQETANAKQKAEDAQQETRDLAKKMTEHFSKIQKMQNHDQQRLLAIVADGSLMKEIAITLSKYDEEILNTINQTLSSAKTDNANNQTLLEAKQQSIQKQAAQCGQWTQQGDSNKLRHTQIMAALAARAQQGRIQNTTTETSKVNDQQIDLNKLSVLRKMLGSLTTFDALLRANPATEHSEEILEILPMLKEELSAYEGACDLSRDVDVFLGHTEDYLKMQRSADSEHIYKNQSDQFMQALDKTVKLKFAELDTLYRSTTPGAAEQHNMTLYELFMEWDQQKTARQKQLQNAVNCSVEKKRMRERHDSVCEAATTTTTNALQVRPVAHQDNVPASAQELTLSEEEEVGILEPALTEFRGTERERIALQIALSNTPSEVDWDKVLDETYNYDTPITAQEFTLSEEEQARLDQALAELQKVNANLSPPPPPFSAQPVTMEVCTIL